MRCLKPVLDRELGLEHLTNKSLWRKTLRYGHEITGLELCRSYIRGDSEKHYNTQTQEIDNDVTSWNTEQKGRIAITTEHKHYLNWQPFTVTEAGYNSLFKQCRVFVSRNVKRSKTIKKQIMDKLRVIKVKKLRTLNTKTKDVCVWVRSNTLDDQGVLVEVLLLSSINGKAIENYTTAAVWDAVGDIANKHCEMISQTKTISVCSELANI